MQERSYDATGEMNKAELVSDITTNESAETDSFQSGSRI